jgi:hypothetical protein
VEEEEEENWIGYVVLLHLMRLFHLVMLMSRGLRFNLLLYIANSCILVEKESQPPFFLSFFLLIMFV